MLPQHVFIASTLQGLTAVIFFMFIAWLASLRLKDASIVDRLWGLNFILLASIYASNHSPLSGKQWLLISLVAIWGLRLSIHIHFRNKGHGEDARYQAMRRRRESSFWWQSFFSVFLLQGILAFLISAPLLWVLTQEHAPLSLLDILSVGLWALGFYFEAMGDRQLKIFKSHPQNKGKILDQGLWSLTRHPNYFGDAVIWWSFFGFAVSLPYGWATFFGPLLMSFFLRYVSGVTLLEKSLRHTKPEYIAYMSKTPAFIPKGKELIKFLAKSFCG